MSEWIVVIIRLIGLSVGILIGVVIFNKINFRKARNDIIAGCIQIDRGGKEADIYRLVWYVDPSKLTKSETVRFEVNPNAKLREKGNDYSD